MEFVKKIIKTDTLRLFCKTPDMTDKLSISFSDSFPLVWQRCSGRQFFYFTVLMSYHLCLFIQFYFIILSRQCAMVRTWWMFCFELLPPSIGTERTVPGMQALKWIYCYAVVFIFFVDSMHFRIAVRSL